jgi:hypothetical protein
MLQNGNFMEKWDDLPPTVFFLINQQPKGWHLEWIEPGQPLYDDPNNLSEGIPECVHKLAKQLPPNEQLGATDALILDGDTTYKIFHAHAPFGATLSQTVTGLEPGSTGTLTVPIQVHLHGDPDAFGAESGVWVNDEGGWVNGGDMGDRRWHEHKVEFEVPADGRAEVVIRVKSKWPRPKDFFIDGITLEAQEGGPDTGGDGGDGGNQEPALTLRVRLPEGFSLRHVTADAGTEITVTTPPDVDVIQE